MNNPSDILRRIQQRRQSSPPRREPATPAPAPIQPGGLSPAAPPARTEARTAPPADPECPARQAPAPVQRPAPSGGHALYSELMRSHDRMGTRHLEQRRG